MSHVIVIRQTFDVVVEPELTEAGGVGNLRNCFRETTKSHQVRSCTPEAHHSGKQTCRLRKPRISAKSKMARNVTAMTANSCRFAEFKPFGNPGIFGSFDFGDDPGGVLARCCRVLS